MGEVRVMMETRAGKRFLRLATDLDSLAFETEQGLLDDAELIFQAHAPKDTTRLARNIHSEARGPREFEIISDVKNPTSGFAYTRITRFGHRGIAYIEPRKDRGQASVVQTRQMRARGTRAALRLVIGGEVMFRRRVRAYKPTEDWAESAFPEVRAEAHTAMTRLGQRIVARLSS